MRKSSVLKPFTLAASIAALACPAFAHSEGVSGQTGAVKATAPSESVKPEYLQLPGSGAMEGTDRTGTTGASGSEAFDPSDGAVDATARMAKPAGDIAATDTDRDLAARIRMAVEGDPALGPGLDKSLHIKVDNGAVTLLGQVMNEQAKEQINAKVTAIAGAHSVDNQLLIAQ
jgi:osmotically-inducible protein OsmY